MRYARQRDPNEREIINALRAAGAVVTQMGDPGVPDLLIGFRGETFLIEVKKPEGAKGGKPHGGGAVQKCAGGDGLLTKSQIKWWSAWTGKPATIVTNPQEALRAIGAADMKGQHE